MMISNGAAINSAFSIAFTVPLWIALAMSGKPVI